MMGKSSLAATEHAGKAISGNNGRNHIAENKNESRPFDLTIIIFTYYPLQRSISNQISGHRHDIFKVEEVYLA